ncbi:transglutaminase family protein [Neotabrizicola sp. sgz301269]|uniref:transglutaminase-like domain-containing protein n=1 Tax=Neotabrizicola sp. sgz301269 TaxID=3276282 RepID=UPI00376FFD9F
MMDIRIGHEIEIICEQATHLVCLLAVHPERAADLHAPERVWTAPDVPVETYEDGFGNHCRRFTAPAGSFTFGSDAVISDTGLPDIVQPDAREMEIARLPADVVQYLVGSRYCETDVLSPLAWSLFGTTPRGWARVQTIADYVHDRLQFGYGHARSTRTASEAHEEQVGVCRDFAHLMLAMTRAMNIPARYVNGYLGDIAVPAMPDPMDFSAWCEVWLEGPDGGRWYTFDARHNRPRVGRVVVARGRDATDVPLINSFGPHVLQRFKVWTDEVPPDSARTAA